MFAYWVILNLWISTSGRCWSCGRKHVDDWRFIACGTHSIFSIHAQWNELGIRRCFLNALCLNLNDNGSNTCLCWFFRIVKWQWLMPTQDPWRKWSKILNFKTGNKNLGFMQVRKETLKVALLGVGLGDLPIGKRESKLCLTCILIFL